MKIAVNAARILTFFLAVFAIVSCSTPQNQNTILDKAKINLEAQIVYRMESQPLARADFYLLNADLLDVTLPEFKYDPKTVEPADLSKFMHTLNPRQQLKWMIEFDKSATLAMNASQNDTQKRMKAGLIAAQMQQVLKEKDSASHIVRTVKTNFEGKASIEDLPPGEYWIMGTNETRSEYVFWNTKVSIKTGSNTVLLDQENALFCR